MRGGCYFQKIIALMRKYTAFVKKYIFFKDKEYYDILHIIGIVPIVASQKIYDSGKWEDKTTVLEAIRQL